MLAKLTGWITGINWKNAFGFIVRHWREVIIAVLIVFVMAQTKAKNMWETKYNEAHNKLQLKDGELAAITLKDGQLRTGGNVSGDSSKPGYVPPEAGLRASVKENAKLKKQLDALNANIRKLESSGNATAEEIAALKKQRDELAGKVPELHIDFSRFGFTCRLGYGVLYNGKFLPEIDIKWVYWGRWSLKTGATKEFVDIGVSRHLDDLIPYIKPRNVEAQIIVGKRYDGPYTIAAGARSNF